MLTGAEKVFEKQNGNNFPVLTPAQRVQAAQENARLARLRSVGRRGFVSFFEVVDGTLVDYISGVKVPLLSHHHPSSHSEPAPVSAPAQALDERVSVPDSIPPFSEPFTPLPTEHPLAAFEASFLEQDDGIAVPYTHSLALQLKKGSVIGGLTYLSSLGGSACAVNRHRRIFQYAAGRNLAEKEYDRLLTHATFAVTLSPGTLPQFDAENSLLYFDSANTPTFARARRAAAGGLYISKNDIVIRMRNGNAADVLADFQEAAPGLEPRLFDARIGAVVFGNKDALARHPDYPRYTRLNDDYSILDTSKLGRAKMRYQDWSERKPPVMRYG